MFNYVALILVCTLGMRMLDDDRNHVSIEEWAIYAVTLFAAWKLVESLIQYIRDHEGGI
ncbi:MAG: hypothetical protein ACK443_11770 [Methylococcaceae bacterium]|jgi:hypothetical protein